MFPRLPLYLPAGMDLGSRWAAHKHGIWSEDRHTAPQWRLGDDFLQEKWTLFVGMGRRTFVSHELDLLPHERRLPALASIPRDAPEGLRAARALKLATPVTS